jgi:hypothetical protein
LDFLPNIGVEKAKKCQYFAIYFPVWKFDLELAMVAKVPSFGFSQNIFSYSDDSTHLKTYPQKFLTKTPNVNTKNTL